jgi:hypothetical protein
MSRKLLIFAILAFSLILSACNLPLKATTATPEGLTSTLAAQTLEAMMTQVGSATAPSQGGGIATATPGGLQPSSTPIPTSTTVALPTHTPVPIPCDAAAYVNDVSIPDGTLMASNQKFIKTWRLKNIGTCTWTRDYALAFIEGNAMGAQAIVNLTAPVAPDQTVDVSLDLTAPSQPGAYRANWKLRNSQGKIFGTGLSGEFAFYVDIRVTVPVGTVTSGMNFVYAVCQAEWSSGAGILPCTGQDGDSKGFVLYQDKPRLENGNVENEPALLTQPQAVNDGVIRGKYPPYTVNSGDHFRAILGCEYNAKNCSVRFQLDYQIDNGAIQTFSYWDENYEGNFTNVNLDLSSLAGKSVRFILTTFANGSATGDRAQWLMPRIVVAPPPTSTPTPTSTSTSP